MVKGLRPGSKVFSSWYECYNKRGVVLPTPKNFPKNWGVHFAWIKWSDGSESGELRRYLYRE
jgi:hypothetical protein